jgi:hypothetical protein
MALLAGIFLGDLQFDSLIGVAQAGKERGGGFAAVGDTLVASGISRSRLSSDGFGSGQPIADNSTEKG